MVTAGRRTCQEHDGMPTPKFRLNRTIGRRVIAFLTFSNMTAVRHLKFEFCDSGPPTKSSMSFDYPVKIWCRSLPSEILRFYDFASLVGKCLTTPPFGVFFLGGG